jgi:multiple sugar transport system substrate-binding protein
MNRRTFLFSSAVGLSLTALPSVRALAQDATPMAGDASLTGTVTFWATYNTVSPEYKVLAEQVIPAFNKLFPNVKVDAQAIPDSDMRQKLLTAVAGGEAPDIARMDIVQVPEFAELGGLASVDDQIPDFANYSKKFYPGPLETNVFKGKHYGLPLDTNTRLLFYNPALLQQAGIDKAPATIDEFHDAAVKVKGLGNGATGFSEGGTGAWNVLPWIWSNGGSITNDDYTVATGYLNSDATIGAIELLQGWLKDGLITETILGGSGLSTSQEIAEGKVAMIVDGPWMPAIFAAQYPDFKYELAPFPSGPGGSISVVGGEDIVMFDSSKNKPAALAFMEFITTPQPQIDFAQTGQMSVLTDFGADAKVPDYFPVFQEQLKTAKPRTPSPAWPKIDEAIGNAVLQVLNGEVDAKSALDDAAGTVDELLAKYK